MLDIFTKSIIFCNSIILSINTLFNNYDNYYIDLEHYISSINNYQIIAQKSKIIPELYNISKSLEWFNIYSSSSNNITTNNRKLLSNNNNAYSKFNLIIKYIYSIIIPIFITHYLLFHFSHKYNITFLSSKLVGLFSFPSLEFIVLFIIINPFIQSISMLYEYYLNTHNYKAKIDTIIAILLLPTPIILLALFYVSKYIYPYNNKNNQLYYIKNIFPTIKFALYTNSLGKWHPKEFENSIGIFYEHIRGPCQNKYINIFRIYHVSIKLIKNSAICFILNCIYNTKKQLILLISLECFNIFNMLFCRPLNGIRQQLCELLSEFSNLFVYIFSLKLLLFRIENNNLSLQNEYYQTNIINSQKTGLGIFILSQIWSGLLSFRLLCMYIYSKIKDNEANHTSSNIRTEVAEGNFDEVANNNEISTDANNTDMSADTQSDNFI